MTRSKFFICLLAFLLFFENGRSQSNTIPPPVVEVETNVPVFIGYTEKAIDQEKNLLFTPTSISSIAEYVKSFGNPPPVQINKVELTDKYQLRSADIQKTQYLLYYSIKLFFDNGGGRCYIVSIGNYTSPIQKNDFLQGFDSAQKKDELSLLAFPEAVNLPGNDLYKVQKMALKQAGDLRDRFCILDLKNAENKSTHNLVVIEFRKYIDSSYLSYAAAYTPYIIIDAQLPIKYRNWKDRLWVDGKNIYLKDLTPDPAIQQKIFALDEAIKNNDPSEEKKEEELLGLFSIMKTIADQLKYSQLVLPPSPAVAAIYSRVDKNRGVWKAPAKEAIAGITGLNYLINNNEQQDLLMDVQAGKSINPIRKFEGKGFIIWGARTLAGNDNEWRYVPVRRFLNMVEESIKKASQWTSFESNDVSTWAKLQTMIENYLLLLWRNGALAGVKPEQAFYVHVGLNKSMTTQDVLEGRLIVEIGIAVTRPSEFIILRFSQFIHGK